MRTSTLLKIASIGAFLHAAQPSPAETIFEQDFENGLGSNETIFGAWSINDVHPALSNDTLMMGHSEAYGFAGEPVEATAPEFIYAYYDLVLDLRGFEDAMLTFDFIGNIEQDFDGFNVLGTTEPTFSPPNGLLTPAPASQLQYRMLTFHADSSVDLGDTAWSSPVEGTTYNLVAAYDLSGFDDQKVTIRFQFGTDGLWGGQGANFDNILVEGTALPDTDNDGLPDTWEEANGLTVGIDDSQGDLDNDELLNFQEFELCTDPDNPDTDGDGLRDNTENNSGVFVDLTNRGTNPALADSDSDGLDDDVETNTGTFVDADDTGSDPNNPDSDGDGFLDGADPDPNDPSVFPTVIFGGAPFTTTHVWNAGTMNLANAEVVTADDSEAGTRIVAETPFIHFHDNVAPPAHADASRPYPLWDDENGGVGGFGARDDFAIRSVGQINIRPPGGLVSFVCNSDDGFSLRIDGAEVGSAGDRGRQDTIMDVNLSPGPHDLEFIHWERGGGAGVSLAVQRTFGGGAPAFNDRNESTWELLSAFGTPDNLAITDVSVAGEMLSITWPSTPGEQFVIWVTPDLEEWEEVNDSYEAQAGSETTSYSHPLPDPLPDEFFIRSAVPSSHKLPTHGGR